MELVQYTVRPGNTLAGIAQFFNTSVNDILRYNNIQDPSMVYVGQTLTIPAGSSPNKYYVTRPGDTLWNVAQRNAKTVDEILELNGLGNPNMIYPGQVIRVD